MPGTTIHSLAYVVTANTEQFEKGMVATRQELRLAKKMMEESVPAIDKYRMAIANADSMLAKGLIDKRAHADTIGKLKTEYGQMASSAALLAQGSERFGNAIKGYAVGAVGIFSVSKAIGAIRSEFLNIDATVKDAEKLGIAIEDLMRLRGVADMTGDASAEAVDKSIAKLNMHLKDLREGSDSAIAMFEQIGLTAESMQGLDLGDAFLKVADGIKNIEGADKQLAITQEILGKGAGDLANMLKMGSDEIERMGKAVPAVNAIDAEKVAKAKDAMESIDRSLTSITQSIAVALAPALEKLAEVIRFVGGDRSMMPTHGAPVGLPNKVTAANYAGIDKINENIARLPTGSQEPFIQNKRSFMRQAAFLDPNFNFNSLASASPAAAKIINELGTSDFSTRFGTTTGYQQAKRQEQLFDALLQEIVRLRNAAERGNEITENEKAKIE